MRPISLAERALSRYPQLRKIDQNGRPRPGLAGSAQWLDRGSRPRDTLRAMSQEDAQRVREGLLASASGDPVAGQRFWDPSIEWDMSGVIGWAEKRVYSGPEVTEFPRGWADSWRGMAF